MNVLSISSHVAHGHVGNSAAVFALQRLGIEVWPVHTVVNHEGVECWLDDAISHAMELVEAIKEGSGKKPQANQRHDYDTDGLPAENLQVRGGGEGRPQHPGGQFLDG